jgi:hypothetical protein
MESCEPYPGYHNLRKKLEEKHNIHFSIGNDKYMDLYNFFLEEIKYEDLYIIISKDTSMKCSKRHINEIKNDFNKQLIDYAAGVALDSSLCCNAYTHFSKEPLFICKSAVLLELKEIRDVDH